MRSEQSNGGSSCLEGRLYTTATSPYQIFYWNQCPRPLKFSILLLGGDLIVTLWALELRFDQLESKRSKSPIYRNDMSHPEPLFSPAYLRHVSPTSLLYRYFFDVEIGKIQTFWCGRRPHPNHALPSCLEFCLERTLNPYSNCYQQATSKVEIHLHFSRFARCKEGGGGEGEWVSD